jgi:hypothetical protein
MVRLLARPAQEIVARATFEAAELSLAVGPEHLLLATVELGANAIEEFDVTADDIRERIRADERDALASLGISLESVRGELEERFGDGVWTRSCLGVSPEAKRVLELATRRRRTVSPEQVQLALLRHSPTVRRLLLDLDVPLGALESRLRR